MNYLQRENTSGVAEVHIKIHTGANTDIMRPQSQPGISHLIEHILVNLCRRDGIEYGMEGCAIAGVTNRYEVIYSIYGEEEAVASAFERFASSLSFESLVRIDKDEILKECNVIRDEEKNNKYDIVSDLIKEYFNHANADSVTGGDSISYITKENILRFHKKYYNSNNMTVVSVNMKELKNTDIIETLFPAGETHFVPAKTVKWIAQQDIIKVIDSHKRGMHHMMDAVICLPKDTTVYGVAYITELVYKYLYDNVRKEHSEQYSFNITPYTSGENMYVYFTIKKHKTDDIDCLYIVENMRDAIKRDYHAKPSYYLTRTILKYNVLRLRASIITMIYEKLDAKFNIDNTLKNMQIAANIYTKIDK